MLTGDSSISMGDAFMRGFNLKKHMPELYKYIGYCPQFDTLFEDLTGYETLEVFALLRGVRYRDIPFAIERLTRDLNFAPHIDKLVVKLSGGDKRKLSVAIALIGNPLVIYLGIFFFIIIGANSINISMLSDEPTIGMDAVSKRNLWKVVSHARSAGKSIVLTSMSMEECEALCTRLAIMVNGQFKCLGSSQYLKNKFTNGFILTIKVLDNVE